MSAVADAVWAVSVSSALAWGAWAFWREVRSEYADVIGYWKGRFDG